MAGLSVIAFDADDTLWHNERFFRLSQQRFQELLAAHAEPDQLAARLLAAETRNLALYGFGIKGFTLSMIETALEITDRRIGADVIGEILDMGREMLRHPIEVFDGVGETLATLAARYPLVLITKGDLFDQERKLAQSGLGELFTAVEIVSDKTAATYGRIFGRFGGASGALMAGNSLRSDILPALAAGAHAVHIPHDLTWDYERVEDVPPSPRLHLTDDIRKIIDIIDKI